MFEAAELGRKVSKDEFIEREPELRTRLLEAQQTLRDRQVPVVVLIAGVDGAGRGDVVNRLHVWLDTRTVESHAFWDETDEEQQRPPYWRYWKRLPARGTMAIMFGAWYAPVLHEQIFVKPDEAALDHALARIADFERTLTADGTLVVKFWFHLSKATQEKRFKKRAETWMLLPQEKAYAKHYDEVVRTGEHILRVTDTPHSPWYVVESEDRRYRDLTVGYTLLDAVNRHLEFGAPAMPAAVAHEPHVPLASASSVTILDHVDLEQSLDRETYRKSLAHYQSKLHRLAWAAREKRRSSVVVFEGWDAAGKGGAIRRLIKAVDARLYREIAIAAPTDEEKAHHYLWRFWRHMPRAGYMRIYDRSWYGRVLVERVEGFAEEAAWMRAYQEINEFEQQLREHGIILVKFWLHISKEEQLRRFKEREETPWKQHKITDEDWRNREKWEAYKAAVNDMVARTSTSHAPWFLIPGNDKMFARVEVLKILCERFEDELEKKR